MSEMVEQIASIQSVQKKIRKWAHLNSQRVSVRMVPCISCGAKVNEPCLRKDQTTKALSPASYYHDPRRDTLYLFREVYRAGLMDGMTTSRNAVSMEINKLNWRPGE